MNRELSDAINGIIANNRTAPKIFPTWVANEAMLKIDPDRVSPPAVYQGCLLYARQLARDWLRKTFERDDDSEAGPAAQHELFPELQARYPTRRNKGGEEQYVLLDDMSADDVAYNVSRLRSEAEAKGKHADALEAWGRKHRRRAQRR